MINPNLKRMREIESSIEALHIELQTRKPTREDLILALDLHNEYMPLMHLTLLQEGENVFTQKLVH